ncbi:MAG: NAD(P)-dependent oxidoreductase [Fuerstiella sp.]|nr:NAD(P)-dependent oxidoreductase [Fuerstiella sp.]
MRITPHTEAQLDDRLSEPDTGVLDAVEHSPGDLIVLGAGGKMGFHLSRMLQRSLMSLGRSDRVITVSRFRRQKTRVQFVQAGFDVFQVDLSDPEQLCELPDAAGVFYLAGVKFGTQNRPDLLEQYNIQMPRLVTERYRHSRIVALSTGCVYPFVRPESGGAAEETPTDAPGDYARSCLGREQACVDAAERWGTQSSLIRLNYSIDLRYGVLVDIAQKVLAGKPVGLDTGYVNVIWQRDAVSHIIQTLRHSSAPPFVLNVTGPEVVRIRDLAESFGRKFNRKVTFQGTEADTAWLASSEKACGLFGVPQTSIAQMIDWTADWLKHDGVTLGKPTHFDARDGKF